MLVEQWSHTTTSPSTLGLYGTIITDPLRQLIAKSTGVCWSLAHTRVKAHSSSLRGTAEVSCHSGRCFNCLFHPTLWSQMTYPCNFFKSSPYIILRVVYMTLWRVGNGSGRFSKSIRAILKHKLIVMNKLYEHFRFIICLHGPCNVSQPKEPRCRLSQFQIQIHCQSELNLFCKTL